MNLPIARQSADLYFRGLRPFVVPAGLAQADRPAYRHALTELLALALVGRADVLARSGLDPSEADVAAAHETAELAENLPEPTAAQMAESAFVLSEIARAEREDHEELLLPRVPVPEPVATV